MSKATEIADAEAREAEAEFPDQEPGQEPAGEPETVDDEPVQVPTQEPQEPGQEPSQGPEPPRSPEAIEERAKSWERERDRHMRELNKRDDYRYAISDVCPICEGHGLVTRPQNENEAAMMRAAILSLVGDKTDEELRPHPRFHRCETCDGEGRVYTGSKVPNQAALNCPDCDGQGHTGGGTQRPPLQIFTPEQPTTPGIPPDEQTRIGNDAWGRPPGHPHYGTLPALVGA